MLHSITILLLAGCVGCTSVSSSVLTRDAANCHWLCHKKIKGMPVTLKVPTHMRVNIVELQFLGIQAGSNKIGRIAETKTPLYKVETEIVKTDKVFFVDMKRPAAGAINAVVDMDPEAQYPTSWNYSVEDETLVKSAELVKALAPGLFSPAAPGTVPTSSFVEGKGVDIHDVVRQVESVVATDLFELDSPTFEAEVRQFVNSHLNCGHTCWNDQNGAARPKPTSHDGGPMPNSEEVTPAPPEEKSAAFNVTLPEVGRAAISTVQ